jgi:hypothetical protein
VTARSKRCNPKKEFVGKREKYTVAKTHANGFKNITHGPNIAKEPY